MLTFVKHPRDNWNTRVASRPSRRNSVDGGRIIYLVDINKLLLCVFRSFVLNQLLSGNSCLQVAFGQSKYFLTTLSRMLNVESAKIEKR